MRQQRVGNLRDREHEDEIEEQFDVGHAVMLMRRARSQQISFLRHLPRSCRSGFRHAGLQRQRVQHAAHLSLQRLIDDLMLLHPRFAAK